MRLSIPVPLRVAKRLERRQARAGRIARFRRFGGYPPHPLFFVQSLRNRGFRLVLAVLVATCLSGHGVAGKGVLSSSWPFFAASSRCGIVANPHKQQIPPLRFAPVGMTTRKKTGRSSQGWHRCVYSGANAGGPSRCHCFEAGVKADSLWAVDG